MYHHSLGLLVVLTFIVKAYRASGNLRNHHKLAQHPYLPVGISRVCLDITDFPKVGPQHDERELLKSQSGKSS